MKRGAGKAFKKLAYKKNRTSFYFVWWWFGDDDIDIDIQHHRGMSSTKYTTIRSKIEREMVQMKKKKKKVFSLAEDKALLTIINSSLFLSWKLEHIKKQNQLSKFFFGLEYIFSLHFDWLIRYNHDTK